MPWWALKWLTDGVRCGATSGFVDKNIFLVKMFPVIFEMHYQFFNCSPIFFCCCGGTSNISNCWFFLRNGCLLKALNYVSHMSNILKIEQWEVKISNVVLMRLEKLEKWVKNNFGKLASLYACDGRINYWNEKFSKWWFHFRLLFSQSLLTLDFLEELLRKTMGDNAEGKCDRFYCGNWINGVDYFRLDGSTSAEQRTKYMRIFNDKDNLMWV